jgi:hypothetical protein
VDIIQELSRKIAEAQALAKELEISLALRKHFDLSDTGKVVPKITKPSGVSVGDYANYHVSITCEDKTVETTLPELESVVGEIQSVREADKETLKRGQRTSITFPRRGL